MTRSPTTTGTDGATGSEREVGDKDPDAASAAAPRLAFRVGVTGTRVITPQAAPVLREKVEAILTAIRDGAAEATRDRLVAEIRAAGAVGLDAVELRMISPLAEGADRLVAEAALGLGYRLLSPLPFAQAEYEKDFPETLDAFRALLARAEVAEIDGAREVATASYEAVGRYVVRNCDLLIAIWDGKPARGRGGTAEIIQFAARCAMPIWWIDLADLEPRLITSIHGFRHLDTLSREPEARKLVVDYVRQTLVPPEVEPPERHGAVGLLARIHAHFVGETHPVVSYLREPASPSPRGLWRTYAHAFDLISPRPHEATVAPAGEGYWFDHYRRADALSSNYASKYRSSYVLISAIALATIVFNVITGDANGIFRISVELVLICCVIAIVAANHLRQWHGRWITYRLLAELCRKQQILAPLGRGLPSAEINQLEVQSHTSRADQGRANQGRTDEAWPRGTWVAWYFNLLQRCAPWPERDASAAKHRAFALARNLVAEQTDYHRIRDARTSLADRRLAVGEVLFILAAVSLVVCLALLISGASPLGAHGLEAVAGIFSAAAATFVGLRAYSEFSLLSRESQRMSALMAEIEAELASLDIDLPLASIELGAMSHRLSILMMHEIDGWAQLFRLRNVQVA